MFTMQAGWLADVTNWLKDQFVALWEAFVTFLGDLLLTWLEMMLNVWAFAIEALPVPDFVGEYSLGPLISAAGPTIGWFVGTFRLGEGLLIIAAGWAFRLVRKLLTLGQW